MSRDNHPVELALLLVSMAAVVLAATAVSERLRVPAPLLLVVVGAVAWYARQPKVAPAKAA